MKAERLLSELLLLQAHEQLSTREIAERLEISQRTAQRDMEALCVAGIPLVALRGAQGGWKLDRAWRTEVPGLDEAELSAMLMAQPSALGDPRLVAAAERAFGKLMAALPGSLQTQAATIRERMYVDPTGWRPYQEDISPLPIVQEAITRDFKLSFDYRSWEGGAGNRVVEPFGLVSKHAIWYLVARTPAGMRNYRIGRISNAVVLSVAFNRPAGFDLAGYWRKSTAELARHQRYPATIALTREAAKNLGRWSSGTYVPEATIEAGWEIHQVEFESLNQAKFVALGLGSSARVIAPQELATAIGAEIQRLKLSTEPGQ